MSEIDQEEEVVEAKPKKSTGGKSIVTSIIIVILLIAGAIYYSNTSSSPKGSTDKTVVATVNGEEIIQAEIDDRFTQIKISLEAQGADTQNETAVAQIKSDILEEIITSTLVEQKAKEAGFSTTKEEVDTEIQKIKDQIGDDATFKAELEKASLTEKTLRENIETQLTIQKYIDQEVDTDAIVITDEEIAAVYDQAAASQTDLPPLADVSEQIKAQIKATKEQELVNTFIDNLKAEAEITRN